jgi:hypothetical protein
MEDPMAKKASAKKTAAKAAPKAAKKSEPKPKSKADTVAESEDSDDETDPRKPVPNDIFDTLLSLVTPSERIQHDVKTRRNKGVDVKKRQNKTRRTRA